MKKFLCLLCLALALCLAGCVRIEMPDPAPQTVYASFPPVYALAEGVCRGVPNMSLYCLAQPQDGCLRSYALSDWDAALLSGADLLILGGRGLESFESAITAGSIPVLTAMENMPLLQNGEAREDDHFSGENPWYFLSVEGARSICSAIAGGMAQLDPDFADVYAGNLENILARFDELQREIDLLLNGAKLPGAVLMQEGLAYFAADMGVTEYIEICREAGTDMSENELEEALAEMEKSGYGLVLIEKQAPQGLIEALEQAGFAVCQVDILTGSNMLSGADAYFAAMLENARAFASAVQK